MNLDAILRHITQELPTPVVDAAYRTAIEALARDVAREIVPDRAYRIAELADFGFRRGRLYKAANAGDIAIRKNGRASYIMGHDLLAFIAAAPTLGQPRRVADDGPATAPATSPRRGRPARRPLGGER
jgi:hypothetical protein